LKLKKSSRNLVSRFNLFFHVKIRFFSSWWWWFFVLVSKTEEITPDRFGDSKTFPISHFLFKNVFCAVLPIVINKSIGLTFFEWTPSGSNWDQTFTSTVWTQSKASGAKNRDVIP
jgi:hypothetical protein